MCSQDNGDMKKQHALFKQYGTINDWIVTGALLAVATCLSYIFFISWIIRPPISPCVIFWRCF